jgi:uncharacterized membrane protein/mono/diheme cytochrome c family protein
MFKNVRLLKAIVTVTLYIGFQHGIARAQSDSPTRDIGSEVQGIFAAKCATCHGPDLAKPKGRFGYVLDLRRVAANPEMVIPHHPDESELWVLVQRDEMPPGDSPHGPLSSAQKEVVRTWIAAGAPDALAAGGDYQRSDQPEPLATARVRLATLDRFILWLGKFHLLVLHFPIALVFAAVLAEALSVWRRSSVPSETVRFCLWLGALSAVPTACLGWLFAAGGNGSGSPQLLLAHRWLGTAASVWLVMTAAFTERDALRRKRSLKVRLLLIITSLMIALTAHLGGLLDRGSDFFDF